MIWKIWACTEGITEQEQQVVLFARHELRKYMSAVTTDSIIVMKGIPIIGMVWYWALACIRRCSR